MTVDTLIINPLKIEFKRLKSFFENSGFKGENFNTGKTNLRVFKELKMAIAQGGQGKTEFALRTQHVVEQFPKAKLLICAGLGGSLSDKILPGDVVIGKGIVEHDYKTKFVKKPLPFFKPPTWILEETEIACKEFSRDFSTHFGTIASGDEDITDIKRRGEIITETSAICVAWEGAGLARTAVFNSKPFIEIRSISDNANTNSSEELQRNLGKAINNLGNLLMCIQQHLIKTS